MWELDDAYARYRAELQPPTSPLGTAPPTPHPVNWERWERVKHRYDAANEALLNFLRGGENI
jgi:hypothetical protein